MEMTIPNKDGKTLYLPDSLCVQLVESMGYRVIVPEDYDPDGWDGVWGCELPEGEDSSPTVGKEFETLVFRIIDASPRLASLITERYKAITGKGLKIIQFRINGTFKILKNAGFDFGKNWEEQSEEFHTKLGQLLDEMIGLFSRPDYRAESEHFVSGLMMKIERPEPGDDRTPAERLAAKFGGTAEGDMVIGPDGVKHEVVRANLDEFDELSTETPADPNSELGKAYWTTKYRGEDGKTVVVPDKREPAA